jgi:predicted DCC family thiol-disulfide oxidoreductase YuxK
VTCLFTIKVQTQDLAWHAGQLRRDVPHVPIGWRWAWGLWHSPLRVLSVGYDMAADEHRVDFGMVRSGGLLSDFQGDWEWTPWQPAGRSEVDRV